MRVVWRLPAEVRQAAEPAVKECLRVAPRWISLLTVEWAKPDGRSTLAVVASPEYREATIRVYPKFIELPKDERLFHMFHEFLHLAYEPVRDVFLSLLKATTDHDSDLWIWAEEEHRRAMEGCITDLELGLGRLLKDQPHKDGHE